MLFVGHAHINCLIGFEDMTRGCLVCRCLLDRTRCGGRLLIEGSSPSQSTCGHRARQGWSGRSAASFGTLCHGVARLQRRRHEYDASSFRVSRTLPGVPGLGLQGIAASRCASVDLGPQGFGMRGVVWCRQWGGGAWISPEGRIDRTTPPNHWSPQPSHCASAAGG